MIFSLAELLWFVVDDFRNHNCPGRPMVYRSMLIVHELMSLLVYLRPVLMKVQSIKW